MVLNHEQLGYQPIMTQHITGVSASGIWILNGFDEHENVSHWMCKSTDCPRQMIYQGLVSIHMLILTLAKNHKFVQPGNQAKGEGPNQNVIYRCMEFNVD